MTYVDGFVIPLPKDKLETYKSMAEVVGPIWMEHGALSYKECVIEDASPEPPDGAPDMKIMKFHELTEADKNETVIFAFITYKSRAHRDEVNNKVMNDPRMKDACKDGNMEMPFDPARMSYGGFEAIVDL